MKTRDQIFLPALFFSQLADQILVFLVPLVVFRMTGSVSWSGIAFTAETLPRYAFFPLLGVLCDRFSPYRLMRASQASRAAACVLGMAGYAIFGGIGWLLGVSALCGVLSSQGLIAREVMLPRMFPGVPFERVLSVTQIAFQAGAVLGPMIAAFLFSLWPWEYVVIAAGFFFLLADGAVVLWRRNSQAQLPEPQRVRGHWSLPYRTAILHVLRLPGLKRLIVLAAAMNLLIGVTLATSAAMVTGYYARSEAFYGVLQAAGVIATIVILSLIARIAPRPTRLGTIAFATMVAGGFFSGAGNWIWVYSIGYVSVIGFDKMFNVYMRSARQAIIPSEDFGKTTGVVVLLNNATQPLAGLLVAGFGQGADARTLIVSLSIISGLVGATMAVAYMVERRRTDARDQVERLAS